MKTLNTTKTTTPRTPRTRRDEFQDFRDAIAARRAARVAWIDALRERQNRPTENLPALTVGKVLFSAADLGVAENDPIMTNPRFAAR